MSRLVVNPGTAGAWEINLKPGANFLGRSDANDFQVNDPSVSGSHCQIHISDHLAVVKDSGSTNGTYVAGSQVRERQLEHGQPVRLGGVEMIFYSDAPGATAPAAAAAARPAVKITAANLASQAPKRVETLHVSPVAAAPPAAEAVAVAAPAIHSGPRYCKYHPKSPGHHFCPKCNLTFCDLCINIAEMGGNNLRTCRKCGTEVEPFQFRLPPAKSFYGTLPGAFGFPFKGAGIVILVCATVAFAALNFISGGIFGIFIKIALYGFVFLFMQNIILTTTSDEKADLCFPAPSGLFGAAFQLAGTVVASFWLAIALAIAKFEDVAIPPEAIIASVVLGGIYFPMALLAVAMKDSVLAANPLVVIPAMLKAPMKYSVTALLTLAVFGIRQLGSIVSGGAGEVSLTTRKMNEFFMAVAIQMVWALLSVYLLTVTMRILGLFYNSTKQKLGWYNN